MELTLRERETARVAMLFEQHADDVFAYVARRVGAEIARDVVGEVFRIALEQFGSYDATLGSPRSWLYGIATNLVRRHWRTEVRRIRALTLNAARPAFPSDPLARVEDQLDAKRDIDRVIDAVSRLSADDRDLLVLIAWEGCSRGEVAEILGIPPGTVRSRLNRIRTQLRTNREAT
jgi:RNA polymerase sigma factor (sigma-70 family)